MMERDDTRSQQMTKNRFFLSGFCPVTTFFGQVQVERNAQNNDISKSQRHSSGFELIVDSCMSKVVLANIPGHA